MDAAERWLYGHLTSEEIKETEDLIYKTVRKDIIEKNKQTEETWKNFVYGMYEAFFMN